MNIKTDCIYFFVLLLFPILLMPQDVNQSDKQIIKLIDKIDAQPVSLSYRNLLNVNNKGGHITIIR